MKDQDSSAPAGGYIQVTYDTSVPSASRSQAPLTEEQRDVVAAVAAASENVAVTAFAGCGKTTTIISACAEVIDKQNKRALIVTYNQALKDENRLKVRARGWSDKQCVVHSFHALALAFYSSDTAKGRRSTDSETRTIDDAFIEQAIYVDTESRVNDDVIVSEKRLFAGPYPNPKFRWPSGPSERPFDLICVDEMQDMTPLFYSLIADFVLSHSAVFPGAPKPRFLVVGDPFQMVFAYRRAKLCYFNNPHEHFDHLSRFAGKGEQGNAKKPWRRMRLSVSFRITHEMAQWVNTNLSPVLLKYAYPTWFEENAFWITSSWGDGIRASPTREAAPASVKYVTCDWAMLPEFAHELRALFDRYPASAILLALSLKGSGDESGTGKGKKKPLVALLELMSDVPWLLSSEKNFEGNLRKNEPLFQGGKRSGSTIVSFKGMECDAVCVFGFDEFAERIHVENQVDPLRLFNAYYVACTRAKKELLVVQFSAKPYATLRRSVLDAASIMNIVEVTTLLAHVGHDIRLDVVGAQGGVQLEPLLHTATNGFPAPVLLKDHMSRSFVELSGSGGADSISTRTIIGLVVEYRVSFLLSESPISPEQVLDIAAAQNGELKRLAGNSKKKEVADADDKFLAFLEQVKAERNLFGSSSWKTLAQFAIAVECVKANSILLWRTFCRCSADGNFPDCRWVDDLVLDKLVRNVLRSIAAIALSSGQTVEEVEDEDREGPSPPPLDDKESDASILQFLRSEFVVTCQPRFDMQAITSIDFDQVYKWVPCVVGRPDFVIRHKSDRLGRWNAVIELKVTASQEHSHYLQVASYAALAQVTHGCSRVQRYVPFVIHAIHGQVTKVLCVPDPRVDAAVSARSEILGSPLSPLVAASRAQVLEWNSRPHCRAFLLRLLARKTTTVDISDEQVLSMVAALEDEKTVINAMTKDGMAFPVISEEQQAVVDAIRAGQNARVIAVAGAGKTTTILAAVKHFVLHGRRCLILTYNKNLKVEIRGKVKGHGWQNLCDVESFHSLALNKYYGIDMSISQTQWVTTATSMSVKDFSPIEFVAIDEAQDMTPEYRSLVVDFLTKIRCRPQMLVVGDPFQQIFKYQGADLEFLLDPQTSFSTVTNAEWNYGLKLKTSYRITHEMAAWVRENLNPTNLKLVYPDWYRREGGWIEAAWADGIFAAASREAAPGSVEVLEGWITAEKTEVVDRLFRQYDPSVAMLNHSDKGSDKTPVQKLIQSMSHAAWITSSEISKGGGGEGGIDNHFELASGKRLLSTIHVFKGLEREAIVVCCFDGYWEKLRSSIDGENFDPMAIYNIMYVACTRAKTKLLLLKVNVEPFMTLRSAPAVAEIRQVNRMPLDWFISHAPRYKALSHSFEAQLRWTTRRIDIPRQMLIVTGKSHQHTKEDSSVLIGYMLLLRLRQLFKVDLSCCEMIDDCNWICEEWKNEPILAFIRSIRSILVMSWTQLAEVALAQICINSHLLHRWRQLGNFETWLEPQVLDAMTENCVRLLLRVTETLLPDNSLSTTSGDLNIAATAPLQLESVATIVNSIVSVCHVYFGVGCISPSLADLNPEWRVKYQKPDEIPSKDGTTCTPPTQTSDQRKSIGRWRRLFRGICSSCPILLVPIAGRSSSVPLKPGYLELPAAIVDITMLGEKKPKVDDILRAGATASLALCQEYKAFGDETSTSMMQSVQHQQMVQEFVPASTLASVGEDSVDDGDGAWESATQLDAALRCAPITQLNSFIALAGEGSCFEITPTPSTAFVENCEMELVKRLKAAAGTNPGALSQKTASPAPTHKTGFLATPYVRHMHNRKVIHSGPRATKSSVSSAWDAMSVPFALLTILRLQNRKATGCSQLEDDAVVSLSMDIVFGEDGAHGIRKRGREE
jgi:superfamily I DNA/RNA helicase